MWSNLIRHVVRHVVNYGFAKMCGQVCTQYAYHKCALLVLKSIMVVRNTVMYMRLVCAPHNNKETLSSCVVHGHQSMLEIVLSEHISKTRCNYQHYSQSSLALKPLKRMWLKMDDDLIANINSSRLLALFSIPKNLRTQIVVRTVVKVVFRMLWAVPYLYNQINPVTHSALHALGLQ